MNDSINVIARQLLVDLATQANEEAGDGYDHVGTLEGLSEGHRESIAHEAERIAKELGPSPEALEAAQRTLARG